MVSTEWFMPVEDDALVQLQFGRLPSFALTKTAPPRLKRHAPKVRSGCVTCKYANLFHSFLENHELVTDVVAYSGKELAG